MKYNNLLTKLQLIDNDIIRKNEALEKISETACLKSDSGVADSVVGVCPHCIACKVLGKE